MSTQPVFVAGVTVFAAPIRFQAKTDATGPNAGMGNDAWGDVNNPLYDPQNNEGLGPKDFPGFVPDIMQPLSQSLSRGGTNEATQSGSLYGPREYATIVKNDWRFLHGTTYFHIVGDANFNFNHPLTNENFGYVEWTVRKGG